MNINLGLDKVRCCFRNWDQEGSGLISRRQLCGVLTRLSPKVTDQELSRLFAALGADGALDGYGLEPGPDSLLRYESFLTWLWAEGEPGEGGRATSAAQLRERLEEDEAARERGLWEGALSEARARAAEKYSEPVAKSYFDEVAQRLSGSQYSEHVKGAFFTKVDEDKDGKVSFEEASALIAKALSFASDMGLAPKPTGQEVRAAFDAHDTLVGGRGRMGADEFLNLARYLQVRVAEAGLPLSRVVTEGTA
jgi:hypothetical protein